MEMYLIYENIVREKIIELEEYSWTNADAIEALEDVLSRFEKARRDELRNQKPCPECKSTDVEVKCSNLNIKDSMVNHCVKCGHYWIVKK